MNEDDNSLNELLGEAVAAVAKTSIPQPAEAAEPVAEEAPPLRVPPRIDGSEPKPSASPAPSPPAPPPGEPEPELEFEDALSDALSEEVDDAEVESPLVALQAENEKLATKNEELSARHLRLMADFDNFRKRNARERAAERRYASEPVLRELLEVVDNMDRAISAGAENPRLLSEGVSMIRNQLTSLLSRFGATSFDSVGVPFDPELQEAVANIPDARNEGEVIEELQKGYHFHDRILRPARVVVSAGNLDNKNETLPNGVDNP